MAIITIFILIAIILVLSFKLKAYKKLVKMDYLSGVFNKRQFDLDINQIDFERRKEDAFLILVDLDKFKSINDTYGHYQGDCVIHSFGDMLRKTLRFSDKIYRIGGDEFAIITNNLTVCDKIRKSSDVSISLGWANLKEKESFKKADEMLYKEKAKKK